MEYVTCDRPVLGTWQSGLIVLHDGRSHAVGKSQVHHNLSPTSTKRLEGESAEGRGPQGGPVRPYRALARRAPRQAAYLLPVGRDDGGEQAGEDRVPRSLQAGRLRWKVLRLLNARAEELGPYLGLVAAQGEVYVQFWLREGEAAVKMSLSDERPEEAIPEVLKVHL